MLGLHYRAWLFLFSLPVPRTESPSSNLRKTTSLNLWAISTLYYWKRILSIICWANSIEHVVCKVCWRKRKVLKYPPSHSVIFVAQSLRPVSSAPGLSKSKTGRLPQAQEQTTQWDSFKTDLVIAPTSGYSKLEALGVLHFHWELEWWHSEKLLFSVA